MVSTPHVSVHITPSSDLPLALTSTPISHPSSQLLSIRTHVSLFLTHMWAWPFWLLFFFDFEPRRPFRPWRDRNIRLFFFILLLSSRALVQFSLFLHSQIEYISSAHSWSITTTADLNRPSRNRKWKWHMEVVGFSLTTVITRLLV